jgi:membrane protein YdbS with pleckstrin-like domain
VTGAIGELILPVLKIDCDPPAPPLGAHAVLSVERAAPGYLNYLRLKWGVQLVLAILGALIVMFLMRNQSSLWAFFELFGLLSVVIGAFLNFLVIGLDYELRWYVITDKSLLIREGIWSRREITLSFANVQNVTVTQGPLQRLFGISDVVVSTAGGSAPAEQQKGHAPIGHSGYLRGVADPQRLRDQILLLLKQQTGAGLGDDASAESVRRGSSAWSPAALEALRQAADEARRLSAVARHSN